MAEDEQPAPQVAPNVHLNLHPDAQQQPGARQQPGGQKQPAGVQQQPGIAQPGGIQKPPGGPPPGGPEGPGGPPLVQQQAPVHPTLPCFVHGCDYVSNPNYFGMQQMALHMPHSHPTEDRNSKKQDKHPRPVAKLDMNEHKFRFFQDEWEDYKNSTGIRGNHLLSELWITMTSDLKKLAFDHGSKALLVTEDQMMAKIKSLAVSVLHPAIHTVCLHEAKQFPEKSTKAFAARVRGIAANCDLQEPCP